MTNNPRNCTNNNAPDRIHRMSPRARGMILIALVIAVMAVIMLAIGIPLLKVAKDAESVEAYIQEQGVWGILIYMLLVILQILAAIVPGGPFEIAGGYLYGALRGALICDLAMTAGSLLVFLLTRKIGRRFAEMFFSAKELSSIHILHSSEKLEGILFLLFLIPGTPKDLISYAAGLTDLSWKKWVPITAIARFPAIYLTALGGTALESRNYTGFILVLVITAILSAAGLAYYRMKNKNSSSE